MEIRSYGDSAAPKIVEGRSIEGYAIVFNQRSNVMYDPKENKFFQEIILPGAVTEDLLQRSDVRALIEHNNERLLARSNRMKGTLALSIDEHGMKYRFDAPNTTHGNDALEMVGRGDIEGSSFAFRANKPGSATWTKEATGLWLRTIHTVDFLHDVCITADPAYTGTDVNVRSMQDLEVDDKPDESYKQEINQLRSLI